MAEPTNTTALTVKPDSTPYPVSSSEVAGVGGFVSVAIGLVLYLRRRIPKDTLEAHKDRTEGLMLNEARVERDKAMADARDAWSQLNAMQREFGRLTAENEYLKHEMSEARAALAEIRHSFQHGGRRTDETLAALNELEKKVSGPAPLGRE